MALTLRTLFKLYLHMDINKIKYNFLGAWRGGGTLTASIVGSSAACAVSSMAKDLCVGAFLGLGTCL